jgi:VanZ family protein
MNALWQKIPKYFWTVSFFGWTALILVLSVIPTNKLIEDSNDPNDFRWDYVEHFGVFVVFAVLFGLWRGSSKTNNRKMELFWFVLPGAAYAVFTEVLQIWVEGRTYNPVDMYLNLGGFILGIIVVRKFILR